MKNSLKSGNVMTFTAPGGGVVGGGGYKIGQIFVVAVADAAAGDPFEGEAVGVFTLPKNTAQAWTEGALLYWSTGASEVTTVSTANLLIGSAGSAALAADPTGPVRLNGIARADG